jgi:hypothetical protein
MASRALIARLSRASSSWLGSTRAAGRVVGASKATSMVGPIERVTRSSIPMIRLDTSTALG